MSKYTTEVRYICESIAGVTTDEGFSMTGFNTYTDASDIKGIIASAVTGIFNSDWPIFDEAYRVPLEKKIIEHYYFREIGFETIGMWKYYLNRTLNEVMPYFNQLYESALLSFDPFNDVDYTVTHEGEKEGGKSGGRSNEQYYVDKVKNKISDTPQGTIENLENDTYLTQASIQDSNGNATNSETNSEEYSDTDSYTRTVVGKMNGMNYSELLEKFRKTFLNIDMMVIDSLGDLFMKVW